MHAVAVYTVSWCCPTMPTRDLGGLFSPAPERWRERGSCPPVAHAARSPALDRPSTHKADAIRRQECGRKAGLLRLLLLRRFDHQALGALHYPKPHEGKGGGLHGGLDHVRVGKGKRRRRRSVVNGSNECSIMRWFRQMPQCSSLSGSCSARG